MDFDPYKHLPGAIILGASVFLTACGGGGGGGGGRAVIYSGNTSAANVANDTTAEELGTTSGEAVKQAANSNSSNVLGALTGTVQGPDINALSQGLAESVRNLPLNLPSGITLNGSCGGTRAIPTSDILDFNSDSGPVDFQITFNMYCDQEIGSNYTIDGKAWFSFKDAANLDAGFSIIYNNVTVNDGSTTTTLNMTVNCSSKDNCTILSDYVSSDGSTYRTADIQVNGNATSGYNGSMTFFHGTYGQISVSASSLTYGQCGVFPDGGTISFSSTNGSSGDITFSNTPCQYTGSWNDGIGGSGSFTGSFN